jgi:lipopolysaccharide/colanic/teichoic acid biosynthesis glycosyltransferase
MAKRLFDIVFALLGLALGLVPGLAIALAIKLDSPGPVFYRQERVGRHGRTFRIFKFRTMRVDADRQGLPLTVGADPRITRVGAWLRHTKLDETAQLIDVLRGTMSLVGPRPEVPRYVGHYPPALRDVVLSVRPGVTDPVSLAYADESARLAAATDPEREYVQHILPVKLAAQARYAREANLATDLRVLSSTAGLLWRRLRKSAP